MQTNSNQLRIDRFFRYLQHVLIKPWRIPPPANEHIVCQVALLKPVRPRGSTNSLACLALFELMFVNVQGANLRIKGCCGQTQPGGSPTWSVHLAMRLSQHGFNLNLSTRSEDGRDCRWRHRWRLIH